LKVATLKKALKREIPLWSVIVVLAAAGLVTAITVSTVAPEKISIFSGQVQDSDFVIDSVVSKPLGKNTVIVFVEVRNTDTVSHSANVTVQLLDENGDIIEINDEIMEQTLETGEVNGGETVLLLFTFRATGLVELYCSYQIVIYQTS